MANTFDKIATITVSTPAATIVFNSIPQTYTDLKIVVSGRNSVNDSAFFVRPNGATTNLNGKDLRGTGSAVTSLTDPSIFVVFVASLNTASVFSNSEIYLPNYTLSTFKAMSIESVSENNATNQNMTLAGATWAQTTAITSITLIAGSNGDFVQYSSATLYGIKSS